LLHSAEQGGGGGWRNWAGGLFIPLVDRFMPRSELVRNPLAPFDGSSLNADATLERCICGEPGRTRISQSGATLALHNTRERLVLGQSLSVGVRLVLIKRPGLRAVGKPE
jgi:hypothetical protein